MTAPRTITFGCRLNTLESEVMRRRAAEAGMGDAVLVNTCAVTAEAVRQARQAIRKARRDDPHARIVVSGCAAQIDAQTFAAMPEVDLVLGNAEKLQAQSYDFGLSETHRVRVNDIMSVKETAGHLVDGLDGRARAFVEVQNGCDHRCTFCIIPYGRGNSRSVPVGAVVEQVRRLAENGYAEVVLTGVDITSWGRDLPGAPKLGTLVRAILRHVPELKRLRLSSIDSIEVDDALMRAIAEEERLMPHLHLSLQHGDDMILKRMKRRHLRADAVRFASTRPPPQAGRRLRRRPHRRLPRPRARRCSPTRFRWSTIAASPISTSSPSRRVPARQPRACPSSTGGSSRSAPSACAKRARRRLAAILPPSRAPPAACSSSATGAAAPSTSPKPPSMPANPARSWQHGSPGAPKRAGRHRAFRGGLMAEGKGLFGRFRGGKPAPAEPLPADAPAADAPAPRQTWFQKLKSGLSRSSGALTEQIAAVFTKRKLDAQALEELEDMLIRADLGADTAANIADALRTGRYDKEITDEEVKAVLAEEIGKTLKPVARPLVIDAALKPHVVLVVGVNGTGKTTTIGKLAAKLRAEGKSVVLAAGDTFRAAAIEQLKIWGERTGATVVAGAQGADAAGLTYDALETARDEGADVLLIDTAGRLQNKDALMAELEKVIRVIRKVDPIGAPFGAVDARRHHRPERRQSGRHFRQARRRHRPGHDQA